MKILIMGIVVLFLQSYSLFAQSLVGTLDHVSMAITNVSTNAAKSEASSIKIERGCLERADIWFAHSTSTPWVTIFSSNALTGTTKDIYVNKVTATNFSFYPRVSYQHPSNVDIGTNGAIGRILLFDEKIYIVATNATPGATTQTIRANFIYERK